MRRPREFRFDLPVLRQFPADQRYLIGVSGGRDSVVLLHQLIQLGYQRLIVCHLNHRLRGRQSQIDAGFVEKLARGHQLEFESGSVNVGNLAKRTKRSIETAGREARYEFFGEIARRRRCRTIFLGHHADDLVETFLINLFRGTGTAGLIGMREVTVRANGKGELTVVRPLLGIWRDQIDHYVTAYQIKFREDASNRSLIPLRNRVRRTIIPFLEKEIGRPIRASMWRAAAIAAEEESFFDELVPWNLKRSTLLDVESLRAMPVALQRRIVHQWLRSGKISNISFDLVERVRALLDLSNRVAKTNLPGKHYVRRKERKLWMV